MAVGVNEEAVETGLKNVSPRDDSATREVLIIALGTQSDSAKRSEVIVYVLDPGLDFEVLRSYRWRWPQEAITAMHYHANCGLIIASFNGFMEIYDAKGINYSVWQSS